LRICNQIDKIVIKAKAFEYNKISFTYFSVTNQIKLYKTKIIHFDQVSCKPVGAGLTAVDLCFLSGSLHMAAPQALWASSLHDGRSLRTRAW
jgi:hypothetical protein